MPRRPRGEGGLHQRADGMWIGSVDLGVGGDGKRRRRTVSASTKSMAVRRLRELIAQKDAGSLPGPSTTVEVWLTRWLADIARPRLSPRSAQDYEAAVRTHLIPHLGAYKMAALAPQHIRDLHKVMAAGGSSSGTVYKVHRYLAASLTDGVREGVIPRSPADLVSPPRKTRKTRDALTIEQATHLLRTADTAGDPLVTRWAAALLLGARQGELLGLTWDRVDLDGGTVDLAWQLQSLPSSHGCGGVCGKVQPARCPSRQVKVPLGFEITPVVGTLALTRPKTSRSARVVPMPDALVAVLKRHCDVSGRGVGFVWTTDGVAPWYPRRDYTAWQVALVRAGLPPMPLHAARNTTASILLSQGVDAHVIQQILGHTSVVTTRGYVSVDQTMARQGMAGLDRMLELG